MATTVTPDATFKLFACCVPVQGARRSTLCDLQRESYRFIPNTMYEILTEHQDKTFGELVDLYGPDSQPTLEEYFEFLVSHEFGFWCEEPAAFPPLNLSWERPERVANAIIDVDAGSCHDYVSLIRQFDDLGCPALQYRFFGPVSLKRVETALQPTRLSRLRSLELVLRHDSLWTEEALELLCSRHPRIAALFVYAAPGERVVQVPNSGARIIYATDVVDSSAHCGYVHPRYFVVTMETFTEGQSHNTCLNRKLSVDVAGNIKNCPAMSQSYGHAATTPLAEVVAQPAFREVWSVAKDQVETCRDCEFRYVCVDCRAFLRDPSNPFSKPMRCGYDPYTATWSSPEAPEEPRSRL